ncbi:MAG: NTP transferase domain-containing protein [Actinobacteria bacterium]|nr:NTP transferase domain-containing protein [Actinomycetota bacterium]
MDVCGVVLCGGQSKRMGREKALLNVRGRPLVVHVAQCLETFADPVILATGHSGRLGDLGYPEVDDIVPNAGPVSGIVAAMRASPHQLVAVLAADMPFASPDVFRALCRLYRGEDAVVPITGDGSQPLHAVYSMSALPLMERALVTERLSLRRVLEDLKVRFVDEEQWRPADPSGRFAFNLNRIEDVEMLKAATDAWTS